MDETTPIDVEIRARIAQVLSGELAFREFYYWFVPATLGVERTRNLEAIRLTHDMAHLFSEMSAGLLTPKEARRVLESALTSPESLKAQNIA